MNNTDTSFTEEEKKLLFDLLHQIQLSPLAPDAEKSLKLIRSIAEKIERLTEKEN